MKKMSIKEQNFDSYDETGRREQDTIQIDDEEGRNMKEDTEQRLTRTNSDLELTDSEYGMHTESANVCR